ncbi:MAG TPA: hypothetical protein VNL71_25295 [Chloroflexota bacterium]|nr:hypothetical protein [Chloroflexota bacterium]
MIASPTMPTLTDLLTDLALREAQKTQHRRTSRVTRSAATALLAAELSQERVALERQLTTIAARLATAAARCEQCVANLHVQHSLAARAF